VLRQKPSYFDIGIHSILDLAIELQEKFVVKSMEELLCSTPNTCEFPGFVDWSAFERLSCDANEFSSPPLFGLMPHDGLKQLRTEFQIPDCIK